MDFTIRVDVESFIGIREGLPKLLDLFKKHKVHASFYLTMGGESNIFEILKNRKELENAAERKIKIFGFFQKVRMLLFPIDFVLQNQEILKRIIDEGHELGIHGWKHRIWTRGLNENNIDEQLNKAITRYEKLFSKKPISFSAPGFNNNEEIINKLKKHGIKYISDFEKNKIYNGIKNIPINFCGRNRMPIIEYLVGKNKTDEMILEIFKKEMSKKKFLSFYMHDLFEARFKIDLIEKIIIELKKAGFKNKRIIDL